MKKNDRKPDIKEDGRKPDITEDDRKPDITEDDESLVESVVNDMMPGMGTLVKNLRKRSPELDQKIKEKDREIKRRLEEGDSPEPTVTHSVKIRSLVPSHPKKAEEREENLTIEPITDLFNEGDLLRVVVEIPGVTMEKIHIAFDKRSVVISAKEGGKRYRKEIPLPWHGKITRERYQNGILELVLEQNDH